MNNVTIVNAARIASALDNVAADIRAQLAASAAESARLMLANGWDPAVETYDIGAMPGDRQVAEETIGRKLDTSEVRALETCIRAHLRADLDEEHFLVGRHATDESVTSAIRIAFEMSKAAGNDDGGAWQDVAETVKALVGTRTGTLDQESLAWTFDA